MELYHYEPETEHIRSAVSVSVYSRWHWEHNPGLLPAEITDRPQWLCWQWAEREHGRTKEPVSPWHTQRRCDDKDPANWSTFEHARATAQAAPRLAGIGYAISEHDSYTGFDFDDCRNPETGEIHPVVLEELRELAPCYAEVSPSGTGVKALVRAEKPGDRCRTGDTPWSGDFEVYDRDRFFALTGEVLEGFKDIGADGQAAVNRIYRRRFPTREPMKHPTPIAPERGMLSDEQVVNKARASRSGAAFARLYDQGDTSEFGGDASRADFALMQRFLCFYTRLDVDQMARIFRGSALYREKKERKSKGYAERTASRAAAGYQGKVYDRADAAEKSREMVEAGMVAPLFTEAWPGVAGGTRHNVYCALLIEATESGTPGEKGTTIAPGINRLAELAGIGSKHTVLKALSGLVDDGLIEWTAKHRARARSRITVLKGDHHTRNCTTYQHAGGDGTVSGAVLCEMRDLLRLRWGRDQFAAASRAGKVAGLLLPWLFVLRDGLTPDHLADQLQRRRDSIVLYLRRLEERGLVIERDGLWYLPEDFWERFHAELEAEGIPAAESRQRARHHRDRKGRDLEDRRRAERSLDAPEPDPDGYIEDLERVGESADSSEEIIADPRRVVELARERFGLAGVG